MSEQTPVYIKEVGIADYKCFQGKHEFSFVDKTGELCKWTVFLGDNNTGKTNLLKAIAGLGPIKAYKGYDAKGSFYLKSDKNSSIKSTLYAGKKESAWSYSLGGRPTLDDGRTNSLLPYFDIFSYGVVRNIERKAIVADISKDSNTDNLFYNSNLINFEDWLTQLDYAAKNSSSNENQEKAAKRRDLLKEVLTSEVFPEINDIRFVTDEKLNNYVEFKTEDGWHKFNELGYGYQSTLSWMVDFCKKLFDRYPDSENPLRKPAILLVDEIDLHLHPYWQRTIVKYLSDIFTQTQFIVTTHSPFVIQSMERVNLYTLQREGSYTKVNHLGCRSFVGWRIEEILSEVMGLEDNIQTDIYQKLMKQFETALNNEDYKKGEEAYRQLMQILHPQSVERKLLDIQMSQLIPDDKA